MLKATGRVAALFLVTGVVGVVLFGVLRAKRAPGAAPASPSVVDLGAPPDVSQTGASSGGGSPQDLIALADEGVWTRVDPATGRVRYRMTWKSLDPAPGAPGEFRIERPRVWMIEDGRTLRLEATGAAIVWPSRDEVPESGEMTGGVVLTVFESEGTDDAALEAAGALGSVRTESMSFNQATRELRTADVVDFQSPGIRASGTGLTLRLGADRSRPVSFLRVERSGRIEFRPAQRAENRSGDGHATPGQTPTAISPFEFHKVAIGGGVQLASGGGTVSGDELTLFARTQGGRFREGAIAEFKPAAAARMNKPPTSSGASSAEANPASKDGGGAVLTWGGSLELRAVRDEPVELAQDDLVARIAAGSSDRVVTFADDATGSRFAARSVEYAATTRRVRATGGVRADLPDIASIHAEAIEMDLTTGRGVIAAGGEAWLIGEAAGTVAGPLEKGVRPRGARWSERAEFSLDASDGPIGSAGYAIVKQLRLEGGVSVVDGAAALESDGLRVLFDRSDRAGMSPTSTITRLAASGSARARDERGGTVSGEDIDVLFEQDDRGEPVPTIATVRENALARRANESLRADLIEAMLRRAPDGDIEIASVEALDNVVGTLTRDGNTITFKARTLRADASLEAADLIGEPVVIERAGASGNGSLSGPSMRIEAKEGMQQLTIFGAGAARFAGRGEGDEPVTVDAEWQGSLIYNDSRGRAEVEGGATAHINAGENERHLARGERIVIDLTPAEDAKRAGAERELVRALIEGTSETPAEVELRRYVAGTLAGGGGSLEGLAFLRGPSIEVSNGTDLLQVEGKGVLLLEDRRAARAGGVPTEAKQGPIEFKGVRGTTLFSWDGGMMLDRRAGSGEMRDNVLIRHKDAATSEIAEVACHRAEMTFTESRAAAGAPEGIVLTRAEATGGVTARYKALQLSSARLIYEAAGRIIVAAEPGGSITIYDEESGQPISGEAAIVDTATGTYRIEKLESVAMPR